MSMLPQMLLLSKLPHPGNSRAGALRKLISKTCFQSHCSRSRNIVRALHTSHQSCATSHTLSDSVSTDCITPGNARSVHKHVTHCSWENSQIGDMYCNGSPAHRDERKRRPIQIHKVQAAVIARCTKPLQKMTREIKDGKACLSSH